MAKKAVVTRTETTTDADEEENSSRSNLADVPLFADKLDATEETKVVARVDVHREEPEEGFLGKVDPSTSESQIFERWGGGKFVFWAKNSIGQIVSRKTVRIAGTPVFQDEVTEARWRRANGLKPKSEGGTVADGAYTAKELMAIIEAKSEAARVESESREEKRRREDADREEKARRDERDWRDRQAKEEREHRERLEKERADRDARLEAQRREDERAREARIRDDEARREKEHERAMQATLAAAKESQEKNQQFFTNMLAMAKAGDKASADPMAQVTQILTIVEALKGAGSGEPQDAVTALLARLPETLQAAGSMVGGAIREAKGLPPVKHEGGEGDDEETAPRGNGPADGSIRLTGAAAAKVKELVMHLVSKGQDPEKVLVAVADYLMGKAPGAAVAAARAVEAKRKAGKPGKHAARSTARGKVKRAGPAKSEAGNAVKGSVPAKPAPTVTTQVVQKPAGAP
jgi:hypothetical protein